MARVSVTTQPVVRTGLNPNLTQPTVDGDIIDSGRVALWVKNDSVAPVNVTVQTPYTRDDLTLQELIVAVPAAGFRLIGPFPAGTFKQPADAPVGAGRVLVDYASVTSVTRGVVRI